jgi:large conductance mechanosensitive channel
MKKFIQEFKDFAIKGNMIELAVAVVIGTIFNNVVSTLVKKVIMPPLSLLTDGTNFANKKWILRATQENMEEVAIGYGELIEVLIDFTIIAFTIFLVIKFMNRFKNRAEDPKNTEVTTPKNIELLSNIEKLLEEQNKLLQKNQK